MPNERLERVRDVWCFCAQTGLAFTDAEHLRAEDVYKRQVYWVAAMKEAE